MKNFPNRIKILGVDFEVSLDKGISDKLDGDCCVSSRRIRVNPNRKSCVQVETFYHEIIHCILGLTGHTHLMTDDQEEALCTLLGFAWMNLMNENKNILPSVTKKR